MAIVRGMLAGLWLLLLAACGSDAPVGNAAVDVGDLNAVATAGPTVEEVLARGNDSVAAEPAPSPAAGSFDHAGRWARTAAMCASGRTWRFTRTGVETDRDTRCTATATDAASATSKRLELRCTEDGIETIERWALNLHSNGTMGISRTEGGNGVPRTVTLQRCG